MRHPGGENRHIRDLDATDSRLVGLDALGIEHADRQAQDGVPVSLGVPSVVPSGYFVNRN